MADKTLVTKKELNPGIVLHKVIFPAKEEGVECIYEFKVELQRLNTIDFTVDFTGSKNVTLDDCSGLVKTTVIQAFETTTVGILKMTRHWTLKSKFRFTIKSAPKALQEQYLKKEYQDLMQKYEKAKTILSKIPVSLSTLIELENQIATQKIDFIDIEFPPLDSSIYKEMNKEAFSQLLHWRRPHEFLRVDYAESLKEPMVFSDDIQPTDIHQGQLGDTWFASALAALTERPGLIERLFVTKDITKSGIYRVKLCKNGEWVSITIDDYFPCYPMGAPVFCRNEANEIWVMALEKAYAKIHGHYYLLKGGTVAEALLDLTGCPTITYCFSDEVTQQEIEKGIMWLNIKDHFDDGYLLCASTAGEERWNEVNYSESLPAGLLPGHGYTVIACKEFSGHKLLNLRNPWGKLLWTGDWSASSSLWTSDLKRYMNPSFDEDDLNFWMSLEDFCTHFSSLHVCRVKNWDEVRIKGKFIRVQDVEDTNLEVVVSKWFYSIDLPERVRLFIGVHQEDERQVGVATKRQYLDIGIVVLKRLNDGTITVIGKQDFEIARQAELEIVLEPGSYIVLPKTSGCLLKRPHDAPMERIKLLTAKGELTDLADSTLSDIFRKFDMLLNRELSYTEFKGFYECINRSLTEVEFKQKVLKRYCSNENGLSLKGFKDFFVDNIRSLGEEAIWGWLENLGYDRELYSVRSRCFILTFHSETEISVTVRDAIQTDLDARTNVQFIEKAGKELESKQGVKCFYYFSNKTHCYTYGIYNEKHVAIEATLDCSGSSSMVFSSKNPVVKKRVEPGQMEFFMHAMAVPKVDNYVRTAKCTWNEFKV
jgi:calpain-15